MSSLEDILKGKYGALFGSRKEKEPKDPKEERGIFSDYKINEYKEYKNLRLYESKIILSEYITKEKSFNINKYEKIISSNFKYIQTSPFGISLGIKGDSASITADNIG